MTTSFRSVLARIGLPHVTGAPAATLAAAAMTAALGSVPTPVFGQSVGPSASPQPAAAAVATTWVVAATPVVDIGDTAIDARVPAVDRRAPATDGHVPAITRFTTRDMLSRLNQPWVQLIDVRPAQEYAGSDIRTLRGGHIPGAINLPIERAPDTATALAPRFAGLDPRKETIVYGNDLADATDFADLLERNGFRQVRLYAPGWPAWANALELPVANERFADVGSLRRQIDELQRTVDRYTARSGAAEPIADALHSANR